MKEILLKFFLPIIVPLIILIFVFIFTILYSSINLITLTPAEDYTKMGDYTFKYNYVKYNLRNKQKTEYSPLNSRTSFYTIEYMGSVDGKTTYYFYPDSYSTKGNAEQFAENNPQISVTCYKDAKGKNLVILSSISIEEHVERYRQKYLNAL